MVVDNDCPPVVGMLSGRLKFIVQPKPLLSYRLDFGQIWLFPQQPHKYQVLEEITISVPTLVYLEN